MSVERTDVIVHYKSGRGDGEGAVTTDIRVVTGPPITPGERELFLTARFRLYAAGAGKLWFADVEHPPWPLREARLIGLKQNLTDSLGIDVPPGRSRRRSIHIEAMTGKLIGMLRPLAQQDRCRFPHAGNRFGPS
jgi:uncharacterized protein YqjF (DUF2071 family)